MPMHSVRSWATSAKRFETEKASATMTTVGAALERIRRCRLKRIVRTTSAAPFGLSATPATPRTCSPILVFGYPYTPLDRASARPAAVHGFQQVVLPTRQGPLTSNG